eukprot:scaffold101830_cov61-Phaeocystis_antarctica.AAC.1
MSITGGLTEVRSATEWGAQHGGSTPHSATEGARGGGAWVPAASATQPTGGARAGPRRAASQAFDFDVAAIRRVPASR